MGKLMICGHTANGTITINGKKVDCCVICDCVLPAEKQPNLSNRVARCSYCGREVPSSTDLPFFKHEKDREKDRYYCGCWGWE